MEPQLYMWSGTRQIFAERRRFYADQIRQRVLNQFQNIEEEAERFVESEFERLCNRPYAGEEDDSRRWRNRCRTRPRASTCCSMTWESKLR